ncbi:histidinol-phosphate transaminase [Ruminococcaceae bacterium OttesenSCG-928-A16]|nr:histidinol-phosphate transaminase [Ruminococcaceae bacterium OttesenSCG-928-A16]
MSRFLHPKFNTLAPYTPGEQPQNRAYIKLNTNECPYPPSPKAVRQAAAEAKQLNLYSDPTCASLKAAMAKYLGVQQSQVFLGNGSDEILAFCFMAFCQAGAAFADITYGFYPVYASLCGITPHIVPLRQNFTLAPEDYRQVGSTIFIANPNAPTGLALSLAELEKILQWNPENLVVVDEAYVDFGAQTALPLLQSYNNLLVVGTFSKSRAMAGARLGYAVGSPELIEDLGRIQYSFNPYNVNRMTQAAGVAALQDNAYFEECRAKIIATRAKTVDALEKMGFEGPQSLANFVFVRHQQASAQQLYHGLKEQGILVRWFNKPRIDEYLRITIGTGQEMDTLFEVLRQLLPG